MLELGYVITVQPYTEETRAYRPAWFWAESDKNGEELYTSSPALMRPVIDPFDEDRKRRFDAHITRMIDEGFKIEIHK